MVDNLDVIKWAFSLGYKLGNKDFSEGIHIDFTEVQKHFITELTDFMEGQGGNLNANSSNNVANVSY